mgnify:CR=1 FL=1
MCLCADLLVCVCCLCACLLGCVCACVNVCHRDIVPASLFATSLLVLAGSLHAGAPENVPQL